MVNALMDSQVQEACGAPRGSRSPERVNSGNGYRERSLSTSLGDLELRVPKLREGTYFPEGIQSAPAPVPGRSRKRGSRRSGWPRTRS